MVEIQLIMCLIVQLVSKTVCMFEEHTARSANIWTMTQDLQFFSQNITTVDSHFYMPMLCLAFTAVTSHCCKFTALSALFCLF